jgi:uncharacterized membrane protein
MNLIRFMKHLILPNWQLQRAFPLEILDNIEAAIASSEDLHNAEIFFAVEGALDCHAMRYGQNAKARALEVFSELRVWDTEANNGVLIYLLLADRDIEIIADRAVHAKISDHSWQYICRMMEISFKQANFEAGVLLGIDAMTQELVRHFPRPNFASKKFNELPNAPYLLPAHSDRQRHVESLEQDFQAGKISSHTIK